ncbi:hypothetical protein Tco_1352071 [Tanacetum coccineum]
MNHKCRVPIELYPCRVEEKLIIRELEGEWIMKKEMRMISKDGTISEFPEYTSSKEEEDEEDEEEEKKEASGMGSNSEPPGYAAIDDDVESYLESTARSGPEFKKMEDTCEKMAPSQRNGPSNDENPDIAAIIAQQLQTILPQIVTQVTNNVNNANANGGNGGNGGNNGKFPTRHSWLACNIREFFVILRRYKAIPS